MVWRQASPGLQKTYEPGAVDKSKLIVRSVSPQDLETPVHLLDTWITPNDLFYVRSHMLTPKINLQEWRLQIDGAVNQPLTLTLDDLRRFPEVSQVVTLECSGNGRALFEPTVAGAQWHKGAVGNARWTGARLLDVLKKAGLKSESKYITVDGADRPMGKMPDYIRSHPLEKAMHPDTILAYKMNGEILPIPHGYPLRLMVPGWTGNHSVKWLTHIRVSPQEDEGPFAKVAYRFPMRPVAPGAGVSPAEMKMITSLVVKSLITGPADGARLAAGQTRMTGVAYAGEANITGVEVSTDLGKTWQPAKLGRDHARYAWRPWEYLWEVKAPGSYQILSRARDDRGDAQPILQNWNPSGYLWNVVDRIQVHVGVEPPPSVAQGREALPEGEGADLVKNACLSCHGAEPIVQQRLTRPQWSAEVDKMVRWGAELPAESKDVMIDYLVKYFKP